MPHVRARRRRNESLRGQVSLPFPHTALAGVPRIACRMSSRWVTWPTTTTPPTYFRAHARPPPSHDATNPPQPCYQPTHHHRAKHHELPDLGGGVRSPRGDPSRAVVASESLQVGRHRDERAHDLPLERGEADGERARGKLLDGDKEGVETRAIRGLRERQRSVHLIGCLVLASLRSVTYSQAVYRLCTGCVQAVSSHANRRRSIRHRSCKSHVDAEAHV